MPPSAQGRPRRSHKRIQSQPFTEHLRWIGEADERPVLGHDPGCAETLKRSGERKCRQGMSTCATERSKRETDNTKLKHTPESGHLANGCHGQQRDHDGKLISINDPDRFTGRAQRSPAMVGSETLAIEPSRTEMISASQIVAAAR
jgi:hypothetical protein